MSYRSFGGSRGVHVAAVPPSPLNARQCGNFVPEPIGGPHRLQRFPLIWDQSKRRWSMIPKSGYRFSEKDHAQT
jgi:hypothetical protein